MQRDVSMGRMMQITHTHKNIESRSHYLKYAKLLSKAIIDFDLANRHKYFKLDKCKP